MDKSVLKHGMLLFKALRDDVHSFEKTFHGYEKDIHDVERDWIDGKVYYKTYCVK